MAYATVTPETSARRAAPAASRPPRRARGRVRDEGQLFPLGLAVSKRKHQPNDTDDTAGARRGRLVAGILAAFAADPDAALTVADIAMPAYGVGLDGVSKAHRVAVLRAMRRVRELEPRFGSLNGEGPEGQIIIYEEGLSQ